MNQPLQPPATIPLNCIDRVYLVPETETLTGAFFPMCITRTLFLKHAVERAALVDALLRLDERFPQFRLGYRLSVEKLRLERVPPAERAAHFEGMVIPADEDNLTALLGQQAARNIAPISLPVQFIAAGNRLSVKMFHVFGDDAFLSLIIRYFLFALLKPDDFCNLPALAARFWSPVYKIVWAKPQQAARVLGRFVTTTAQKVFRYRSEVGQGEPAASALHEPIVSGSEMGVVLATLPPAILDKLHALRRPHNISLNTLLQVEIARRLQARGYLGQSVCFSTPVDLHRYLRDEKAFYPGNLSTQIRVTLDESDNLQICDMLQAEIRHSIEDYQPLSGLPFEWVMNMMPRRVYDGLHRSWMLNAMRSESRFFVLTNLGSFDSLYEEFAGELAPEMYLTVPIMDTPMVISFNTFQGQGNFCATFDPRVLSGNDVRDVLDFENNPLVFE